MAFHESFDPHARYRPLTVIGGFQLYLIQVLVLVHAAGMAATAFSTGFGGGAYAQVLALNTWDVMEGSVWQLVTYPFVDGPTLWFLIAMLITFFFVGPEVEKYIGRGHVAGLYGAMIVIPSVLLLLASLVLGQPLITAGCLNLMFGFFIALCVLYPGMMISIFYFQISLRMAGWLLLGINSLMYIATGGMVGLAVFWLCPFIAYLYLKSIGVQRGFGRFSEWMEGKRLEREARRRKLKIVRQKERERSIDEILDKISKQGIGSLTPGERETLERARTDLMKRDGGK